MADMSATQNVLDLMVLEYRLGDLFGLGWCAT
jgi:hypothetical protein